MVSFADVKQRFPLSVVVEKLGLKLVHYNDEWRGQCPECKGGGRSLVITEGKGFTCFDSNKKGSVIDLVSHIRQISLKDAAEWLDAQQPEEPEKPNGKFDRAKYQAGLNRTHELLKDIPSDLIARLDLGVPSRGSLKDLINVPLYDSNGAFVCYAGVANIQLPKTIK